MPLVLSFRENGDLYANGDLVEASPVTVTEATPAAFQTGTLSGVAATKSGLTLSRAGTDYTLLETSQADFLTGTLTGVTATAYDRLELTYPAWGTFLPVPGSGSASRLDTGSYCIYNTNYYDSRWQYTILALELYAIGISPGAQITALQFCPTHTPGVDIANVRIRLQHTAEATPAGWVTDGWTEVYGPATIARASLALDAWHEHPFTTSFTWDGVSHLLIDLTRDGTSGYSGGGMYTWSGSGLTDRSRTMQSNNGYTWPYDAAPSYAYSGIPQTRLVVTSGGTATIAGSRLTHVLDISSVGMAGASAVNRNTYVPDTTTLAIETNLSTDGGASWSGWQPCSNGGAISGIAAGADLSQGRLQIRQSLSRPNTETGSPLLYDMFVWIPSAYVATGHRLSPLISLKPVGQAGTATIAWVVTLPTGAALTVETNLSTDGGATWQGWQACVSGETIPGVVGANLTNALLQVRETLSTTDCRVAPTLGSLTVTIHPADTL